MKRYAALLPMLAAVAAALLIAPPPTRGQESEADKAKAAKAAAKAKAIARTIQENARKLTLFDRTGTVVKTVGESGLYQQPSISPDGTKIAVIRADLEGETSDLWVINIESGAGTKVTKSKAREAARSPVWAPGSDWVAFAALRDSYDGIYRVKADGSGAEELLYKLTGAGAVPTDWSLDGKFINYYVPQLGDNVLYALPLEGRTPVVVARSQSEIVAARLSPDSRFLGYRSNETGRNEVWVRAFDPANPNAPERKWQISDQGGLGMVWWRRDGRELYYFAADRGIMAVSVSTAPALEFGKPKLLFKAPNSIPNGPNAAPGNLGSVSRDGERVVFSLPPAPRLQQLTMFDRTGKVIRTIGAPAQIGQAAFSPDGKTLAFVRNNPDADIANIWTLNLDSGKETQITNDSFPHNSPTWSPDGKHIAYQSNRGLYTSIYWRNADGTGSEEMLFRYTPGAGLGLTDFTPDGKYVLFDGGAILMAAPLTGSDPLARTAVEMSREEYEVGFVRVSPDGRYVSYGSNEVGNRLEVFIRPFNAANATLAEEGKVQATKDGPGGGNIWRGDGKEVFYLRSEPGSDEVEIKSVEITAGPTVRAGEPKLLFKLKDAGGTNTKFISPDGQRFVFAMLQR